MAFVIFCVLALLLVLGLVEQPYWRAYRSSRVSQRALPAAWRKILQRRVPLLRRMPVDLQLQLQLKKHMQVFIAEKDFIGCAGLQVTDEMRVVIAAQACLLVLNRGTGYFDAVRQILVYPGAFVVQRTVTDGAGESWSQGRSFCRGKTRLMALPCPTTGATW